MTTSTVINQPYSTSGNGGRKLVRLANGWLVIGVKVIGTGISRIYFYKSEDDGKTWTYIRNYGWDTSNVNSLDVSLVAVGNLVYFMITRYGAVSNFFRIFNPSTGNYIESPTDIDRMGSGDFGNGSLVLNPQKTEIHATWSYKGISSPNSFNIKYAKGTINGDGSVTWSAPEQVTTINDSTMHYFINPSINIVNNIPCISFEGQGKTLISSVGNSSRRGIYFAKRDKSLTGISYLHSSWSGSVVAENTLSHIQSSPSAVVDNDGVIANVWHGKDSTHSTIDYIRFSKSIDGGVTWSAMQKLVVGNNGTLTVDKDNKYVIQYEDSGIIKQIISTNKGDTWSSPVNIGTGTNPNSLYDNAFVGKFGYSAPSIFMTSSSVMYSGEYIVNKAPTIIAKDANNETILAYSQKTIPKDTSFTVRIIGDDEDVEDAISWSISIENGRIADFGEIPITKGQEFEYTISHSDDLLAFGQNRVDIAIKDSKGDITVLPFYIEVNPNLPIGSSCLANMKFNGYNKSTLSLAELVNHLT